MQSVPEPTPPLACTVRGCGRPLVRSAGCWRCEFGHSFDVARRGYVNLLQPSDRKSLQAGDTKASVEARAHLVAAGVGASLLEQFIEWAASPARAAKAVVDGDPRADDDAAPVVVDLGCGSGDTLTALARRRPIVGVGIDLSTAAAEHAARHSPALTWVVANADRRLPLLDASVDLVVSQQGRRNPAECARVLKPGGHLLVSVPAADDLIELREAVQGVGVQRNRADALIADHALCFTLVARTTARVQQTLERPALLDLLRGTYRGARHGAAARLDQLERLAVTLSWELCLFRNEASRRRPSPRVFDSPVDTSVRIDRRPTTEDDIRAAHVGPITPLDGRVLVVDYDARWADLFEREAVRIKRVLQERALRVEHVGSTSVPGLAAKPVVDIVLVVVDSADEAAYVPLLEAAGYRLDIREVDWYEHRMFKGPDADVNLHTFSAGCVEVDRMLAFRNWLRTNQADRELYAQTKLDLAQRNWTWVQDYADAKTEVIDQIMARARAADASGSPKDI